jgi:serine protease Do
MRSIYLCGIIRRALSFLAAFVLATLWTPRAFAEEDAAGGAFAALAKASDEFEALAERVAPSVVQVFAAGYAADPWGASSSNLLAKERSIGSGVVLDASGYIVTNAHVVAGASRVQVMLAGARDGDESFSSILKPRGRLAGAQLIGLDRETDLAVLKVDTGDLPALELGDSDEVRQAQLVFAFGAPLGLESSVSAGVVSAVARQLRPDDPMIYLQTDASINPGNSGGPLVDAEGRVVGINTFILSQSGGSEGIGFAVPSNIVRNVFEQIRKTGRVRRGEIGVRAQTITPALAKGLGLDRDWGVILGDVEPGGPADVAGVRAGDIVETLDGKKMENGRQLDVNIYRRAIGESVALEVRRGGSARTYTVTVVERDDDPGRFADLVSPEQNLVPQLGILGIELDAEIAAVLPRLRTRTGVLVAARASSARSWEEGFEPGDVIHSLNGAGVETLASLRAAAAKLRSGDAAVAQVERRSSLLYVAFEVE